MDRDHVNGLTLLLRDFHFDYILLPLFPWPERLSRAASYISHASSEEAIDEWYLSLLANPRAALQSIASDTTIIEVSPPSAEFNDDQVDNPLVRFEPNPDWSAESNSTPFWTATSLGPHMPDNQSWSFGPSTAEQFWTFLPHVDPGTVQNSETFTTHLRNSLPLRTDGFQWDFSDGGHLEELVESAGNRDLMNRSYKATVPSINGTSLTLLSTVIGDVGSGGAWKLRRSIHTTGAPGLGQATSREMWYGRKSAIGWLGLGDSDMSGEPEGGVSTPLHEVISCFGEYAHGIHTVAIPHHGSGKDFSSRLLDTFDPVVCVASAASTNKYGHPHPEVIMSIAHHGSRFAFVTEGPASEYSHVFELERI